MNIKARLAVEITLVVTHNTEVKFYHLIHHLPHFLQTMAKLTKTS